MIGNCNKITCNYNCYSSHAIAIVTLHMIAIILWVIYITVIALHTPLKLTVQIIAIVSISEVRTERHHEHCE
jgi:hypothetical protein